MRPGSIIIALIWLCSCASSPEEKTALPDPMLERIERVMNRTSPCALYGNIPEVTLNDTVRLENGNLEYQITLTCRELARNERIGFPPNFLYFETNGTDILSVSRPTIYDLKLRIRNRYIPFADATMPWSLPELKLDFVKANWELPDTLHFSWLIKLSGDVTVTHDSMEVKAASVLWDPMDSSFYFPDTVRITRTYDTNTMQMTGASMKWGMGDAGITKIELPKGFVPAGK